MDQAIRFSRLAAARRMRTGCLSATAFISVSPGHSRLMLATYFLQRQRWDIEKPPKSSSQQDFTYTVVHFFCLTMPRNSGLM